MTTALFPGTFDPFTNGHLDIIQRASGLFDQLIIGVYAHPIKTLLFSCDERVALVKEAVREFPNVRVESYDGLTVEFARLKGAQVLLRGLRVIADFELEFQMALMNRALAAEIETVCLMTTYKYYFLSSSLVKEVAKLGGDISTMVPPHVEAALKAKIKELDEKGEDRIRIISLRE